MQMTDHNQRVRDVERRPRDFLALRAVSRAVSGGAPPMRTGIKQLNIYFDMYRVPGYICSTYEGTLRSDFGHHPHYAYSLAALHPGYQHWHVPKPSA